MKILVTGGTGLVGYAIQQVIANEKSAKKIKTKKKMSTFFFLQKIVI